MNYPIASKITHSLHWHPIRERIRFKLALLVYKACMNHLPAYVSSIDTLRTACSSVKDRCFLRSASAGKYVIPGACLFFGQHPFYCHWLLHLEFPTPQVCIFSLRLSFDLKSKTHLFNCRAYVWIVKIALLQYAVLNFDRMVLSNYSCIVNCIAL